MFEPNLDGGVFGEVPDAETILNRLVAKDGQEDNVYLEELNVSDIGSTGCKVNVSKDSFHYKFPDSITFNYQLTYKYLINDFFPNEDYGKLSVMSGTTLPKVCPTDISAYDLSMNYHDIPYQGNYDDQQYHFYWDESKFENTPGSALYNNEINQLRALLSTLTAKVTSDNPVPFNLNQIHIESITDNNDTFEPKYKVVLKTDENSNFYQPNTSFTLWVSKKVFTPITSGAGLQYTTYSPNNKFWGGYYYLANDIETGESSQK